MEWPQAARRQEDPVPDDAAVCSCSISPMERILIGMNTCSTDYVLVQDKSFKKYAKAYADDNDLFFKEYAVLLHTTIHPKLTVDF
jgi:catalase (peroxidase I)